MISALFKHESERRMDYESPASDTKRFLFTPVSVGSAMRSRKRYAVEIMTMRCEHNKKSLQYLPPTAMSFQNRYGVTAQCTGTGTAGHVFIAVPEMAAQRSFSSRSACQTANDRRECVICTRDTLTLCSGSALTRPLVCTLNLSPPLFQDLIQLCESSTDMWRHPCQTSSRCMHVLHAKSLRVRRLVAHSLSHRKACSSASPLNPNKFLFGQITQVTLNPGLSRQAERRPLNNI